MGYSLSWLAVKGMPAQAIRDRLGFRPTGEREEFPESELSAAHLPNGWYVIVSDHTEQVASEDELQKLSASGCELVTCFVEEHVMVSAATGWKDGRKIWSISHESPKGQRHLDVQGEPPLEFPKIRDTWVAKTDPGVDYIFEIPVAVAASVAGYRYDRSVPGLSGDVFEVLEHVAPQPPRPKPPLPQRSFSGRLFRRLLRRLGVSLPLRGKRLRPPPGHPAIRRQK